MEESIKRLLPLGRQRYNAHWCHSLDGKLFQLEAYDAVVEKLTQSLKKSFFFFGLLHGQFSSTYSGNTLQYFPLKLVKTFIIYLDI